MTTYTLKFYNYRIILKVLGEGEIISAISSLLLKTAVFDLVVFLVTYKEKGYDKQK